VSNLLEDWVPRLYRFALRLCNDAHTAEDLTQETFLRAWQHRRWLRDERAIQVWLFRIAANLWRDRLRRGQSLVAKAGLLEDRAPDTAQPPDQLLSRHEDLARVLEAMKALPQRQREVLYLLTCEGLALSEVAQVLSISAAAAKASLSLARKRLRSLFPELFPQATAAECDDP